MTSLSPNIFVSDMKATIAFYTLLGFDAVAQVPDEGDLIWVMMTCGDVSIMFQTYHSLGNELPAIHRNDGGSLLFYIKMNGLRALHDKIKNEVTIIQEIHKTFYGATEFSILDLNGYVLTFAEDEPGDI